MKKLLPAAAALAIVSASAAAQADIITYEFEAEVTFIVDGYGLLDSADVPADTLRGSFTYDTDAAVLDLMSFAPGGEGARYDSELGLLNVEGVDIAWVDEGVTNLTIMDNHWVVGDYLIDQESGAASSLNQSSIDRAGQHVVFAYGDSWAGTALPETLSLDDFSAATYSLTVREGETAYGTLTANITSLTRAAAQSSSGVPELSATGSMGAGTLLLGLGLVFAGRRRRRQ